MPIVLTNSRTADSASTRLSLAVLTALISGVAAAQELPRDHFTWSAWAGLEYTDNVRHSATDRQSDLLFAPGVLYSVLHTGTRWRIRGDGELKLERGGENLSADPRAHASLIVDWALVPHRLYWNFQDFAEVQSIDPLAADDPANRQQTNLFQTGPVLVFGSPRTVSGRLEAQFARAWAEHAPDFDHDRHLISAWAQRQSYPVSSYAIGLESSEVSYNQAPRNRDFRRQDLLLRHERELPRSALSLSVGHSRIDIDSGDRLTGALARLRLRWSPDLVHEFGALMRYELSDAGRELTQVGDLLNPFRNEPRRTLIGTEIYKLRSADLHWQRSGVRSRFRVAGFVRGYDHQLFQEQALKASQGAYASFSHELTPQMRLIASAGVERYEFEQDARSDRDTQFGLGLEHDLTPNWKVRGGISRRLRASSEAFASYHENLVSVQMIYAGGQ